MLILPEVRDRLVRGESILVENIRTGREFECRYDLSPRQKIYPGRGLINYMRSRS
jgi:hypothetical protein